MAIIQARESPAIGSAASSPTPVAHGKIICNQAIVIIPAIDASAYHAPGTGNESGSVGEDRATDYAAVNVRGNASAAIIPARGIDEVGHDRAIPQSPTPGINPSAPRIDSAALARRYYAIGDMAVRRGVYPAAISGLVGRYDTVAHNAVRGGVYAAAVSACPGAAFGNSKADQLRPRPDINTAYRIGPDPARSGVRSAGNDRLLRIGAYGPDNHGVGNHHAGGSRVAGRPVCPTADGIDSVGHKNDVVRARDVNGRLNGLLGCRPGLAIAGVVSTIGIRVPGRCPAGVHRDQTGCRANNRAKLSNACQGAQENDLLLTHCVHP